jgi:hypothetical protein
MMKIEFKEKIWKYPAENGAWYFIHVPKALSAKIKKGCGASARGWGSLPVSVTIGRSEWRTSLFPDKRSGTYLLPVKASVRKKEGLDDGDKVKVNCIINV